MSHRTPLRHLTYDTQRVNTESDESENTADPRFMSVLNATAFGMPPSTGNEEGYPSSGGQYNDMFGDVDNAHADGYTTRLRDSIGLNRKALHYDAIPDSAEYPQRLFQYQPSPYPATAFPLSAPPPFSLATTATNTFAPPNESAWTESNCVTPRGAREPSAESSTLNGGVRYSQRSPTAVFHPSSSETSPIASRSGVSHFGFPHVTRTPVVQPPSIVHDHRTGALDGTFMSAPEDSPGAAQSTPGGWAPADSRCATPTGPQSATPSWGSPCANRSPYSMPAVTHTPRLSPSANHFGSPPALAPFTHRSPSPPPTHHATGGPTWTSPSKIPIGNSMRTPVRSEQNSLFVAGVSPMSTPSRGLATPSSRTTPQNWTSPRQLFFASPPPSVQPTTPHHPPIINVKRVLEASSMSSDPLCKTIAYGDSCHLLAVLGDVVFQWSPSGVVHVLMEAPSPITVVAASPVAAGCPPRAAVGLANGLVYVFDFAQGSGTVVSCALDTQLQARITCLGFHENTLYVVSDDGVFCGLDVTRRRTTYSINPSRSNPNPQISNCPPTRLTDDATLFRTCIGCVVWCMDVSADGNHVALGCEDGYVRVFHKSFMQEPTVIDAVAISIVGEHTPITSPQTPNRYPVRAVCWAPLSYGLGTLVFGGGERNQTVVVFSLSRGCLTQWKLHAEIHAILCATTRIPTELFVAHGRQQVPNIARRTPPAAAAVLAQDHIPDTPQVTMFEMRESRLKRCSVLTGHRGNVLSMCFDRLEHQVITAAVDESVRFYDIQPASSSVPHATIDEDSMETAAPSLGVLRAVPLDGRFLGAGQIEFSDMR